MVRLLWKILLFKLFSRRLFGAARAVFLILPAVLFLSFPNQVLATPVISEVFPQPQDGPEWVELHNPDNEPVNLTGWTLYDQLASPALIYTIGNLTLEAGGYTVFELTTMKLNNGADGVVLYNTGSEQIDAMQYETSTPGKSWSRRAANENVFLLTDPTPGSPNLLPTPTPPPTATATPTPSPATSPLPNSTPPQLTIEEIHPCPLENQPEWIVIKNHGTNALSLENWKIRDEQNNFRSLIGTIPPGQTQKASWQQAMLNNTGDSVFIETPTGETVATASYSGCTKGETIYPQRNSPGTQNSTDSTAENQPGSAANSADSTNPTNSAANQIQTSTPNRPLPDFTTTPQNNPPTQPTGKAIYAKTPTQPPSQKSFLNVILGGFAISSSGVLLLYEKRITQIISAVG